MPIVEAAPERDELPKGVRSLRQICLDRAADAMLDTPGAYGMVTALPWSLQQDLWTLFMDDRREKQELKSLVNKLPLADREKLHDIDKNAQFIRDHPESFSVEFFPGFDVERNYWTNFLGAINGIQRRTTEQHLSERRHLSEGVYEIYLVENSRDSLLRFSICMSHDCSHQQHFALHELVSPELLMQRLHVLHNAPGCSLTDGWSFLVRWAHGGLAITIDIVGSSFRIWANWDSKGDRSGIRSAEVYLNAILSPIESDHWHSSKWTGRNAFARRYVKLLVPADGTATAGSKRPPWSTCTNIDTKFD
ncbi:uncharacterized protein AB675_11692 [Cyphellophora attinorum]|uniref:Uncharacterized protein n=1 Tax=Cyphellophora attinorum TaxID=1664694 RepID=A0A0N0NI82_9EURO|nr:uncharacterized protein AB675_11692 [Phialophora attinorum]KPI35438.1 hypothetical protein AB675_11692 [Phialophora attinorum]